MGKFTHPYLQGGPVIYKKNINRILLFSKIIEYI